MPDWIVSSHGTYKEGEEFTLPDNVTVKFFTNFGSTQILAMDDSWKIFKALIDPANKDKIVTALASITLSPKVTKFPEAKIYDLTAIGDKNFKDTNGNASGIFLVGSGTPYKAEEVLADKATRTLKTIVKALEKAGGGTIYWVACTEEV